MVIGISIHAPTWGATVSVMSSRQSMLNFNPRTHVGCDHKLLRFSSLFAISIHAPTWGATREFTKIFLPCIFQSTHPRGVRQGTSNSDQGVRRFQSTHPRGVRPTWSRNVCGIWRFQSTHPRGVRQRAVLAAGKIVQFQSTHPRGVRRIGGTKRSDGKHFNPRTHVGCDRQ